MGYIFNILVSIDQLGNAIAGGNPDNTISGRTGYFARHSLKCTRWYWKTLEFIIDFTFYPLDGFNHCLQAYQKEPFEKYYPLKGLTFFIFTLLVIPCCIILMPVINFFVYIKEIFKKVKKWLKK